MVKNKLFLFQELYRKNQYFPKNHGLYAYTVRGQLISRDSFVVFRIPDIRSCLMILAYSWLDCFVLVDISTHLKIRSKTFFMRLWKWPQPGLRLSKLYVIHPTVKPEKKSKYSSVFQILLYFRELLFKFWLWLTWRTLLCVYMDRSQKFFHLLWREHIFFIIFFLDPKRDFKYSFFTLFRTSETLFSILTLTNIKNTWLHILW